MDRYFPITTRGLEMSAQGVDDSIIREYEAAKMTVDSARGQQELLQRHPDAGSPDMAQRINEQLSTNRQHYDLRLRHETASDLYEDAYMRARLQAEAAPTPGAGGRVRRGIDLQSLREKQEASNTAREHYRLSGDLAQSGRLLGMRIDHPDLDVDPRG